ncbi:MAG: LemA family protein [bacterium]
MEDTIIVGLIAIGLIIYLVGIYNQLIQVRVNIDKSWANIEVLQKQRYDEIPKLVKVCEGYMKYERETLEKITLARTKFLEAKTPSEIAKADTELAGALKSLFGVAENYPELKANENFMQLQNRVSYLESQIADRREFYNDSVTIFNTRIQQIPDVFIANILKYTPKEMYKVLEGEKVSPEIKFQFP